MATEKKGIEELWQKMDAHLHSGHYNKRKSWLLTEKAWHLLVKKRMQGFDKLALQKNIDVPYSCQGGVCSSCIAKITVGSATMIQNNILTESEIKEGLVLTCQAIPETKEITVDFNDL